MQQLFLCRSGRDAAGANAIYMRLDLDPLAWSTLACPLGAELGERHRRRRADRAPAAVSLS
jgi:hypothetical protein